MGVYLQNSSGTLNPEDLFPIPSADSNPHGVAIGDINSDGLPDIVIADYNRGLVVLYNTSPPPPLRISRIKVEGSGRLILTAPYPGPHGAAAVLRSEDLVSWTQVGIMTDGEWTDVNASGEKNYFYRLADM